MKSFSEFTAQGDCFRNVNRWNARYAEDSDRVVHGTVTNGAGKTFAHAWIERGDTVIDPTQDIKIPKAKYYTLLHVTNTSSYTSTEAIRNQLRARHHGPWTAADLA